MLLIIASDKFLPKSAQSSFYLGSSLSQPAFLGTGNFPAICESLSCVLYPIPSFTPARLASPLYLNTLKNYLTTCLETNPPISTYTTRWTRVSTAIVTYWALYNSPSPTFQESPIRTVQRLYEFSLKGRRWPHQHCSHESDMTALPIRIREYAFSMWGARI